MSSKVVDRIDQLTQPAEIVVAMAKHQPGKGIELRLIFLFRQRSALGEASTFEDIGVILVELLHETIGKFVLHSDDDLVPNIAV